MADYKHTDHILASLNKQDASDEWLPYDGPTRNVYYTKRKWRVAATAHILTANKTVMPRKRQCDGESLPLKLIQSWHRKNASPCCAPASHTIEVPIMEKMNDKQRSVVLSVLCDCKSVFFTGPAGCGKTFVLESILQLNQEVSTHVDSSL
jgi:hypothetical protein